MNWNQLLIYFDRLKRTSGAGNGQRYSYPVYLLNVSKIQELRYGGTIMIIDFHGLRMIHGHWALMVIQYKAIVL